jgi:alkanesulfonate monooxygenase SsuD/methylene tetrahydromethanopterin reductase-like flavin-dependent oxidoreductase (luciferase family)
MEFRVSFPASSLYPGGGEHWWKDVPWSDLARLVRAADELGYDWMHVSEHMAMHVDDVDMMGPRWVHTISTMGWLAGLTQRLRVGGLIVVPYHHPVELAKAFSTLQVASEGRAIMAAAVGYMPWEYELMGAPPYAERGAYVDECMEAMLELWSSERPRYEGRYVRFDDIVFDPNAKPTLWFAGNSKAAVRRAARYADGWYPNALPRQRFRELVEILREQPGFAERARPFDLYLNLFEREVDLATHSVKAAPKVVFEQDAVLEQIAELAALGVTLTDADSIINGGIGGEESGGFTPVRSVDEFIERMQWFAEEIFPEGRTM